MDFDKLTDDRTGEPSEIVRARVESARAIQRARFRDTEITCNADMGPGDVLRFCELDDPGRLLVRQAMQQMQLSARAYHRVLKLARSIADLEGAADIRTSHLAEGLQYRPRGWE